MRLRRTAILLSILPVMLGGCKWRWPWQTPPDPREAAGLAETLSFAPDGVGPPLGGVPGGLMIEGEPNMENPLAGNPRAVADGHRLYRAMNCASCHGYTAKGGMGPDLTDKQWRYAGTPAALFNSISQGRPQGMPSWGNNLPDAQIWAIVAYLQSLGGTYAAGQYNASLDGDTPGTQIAPGYVVIEKVTSALPPPRTAPPRRAATTGLGLKQ